MAFQISLNGTYSEFNLEYYDGIILKGPYEVCLKSFVTYNNIPNINEDCNLFMLTDDTNQKRYEIKIATGTYELNELINLIKQDSIIKESKTEIKLNRNTFQVEITSNLHVDFYSEGNMGRIFGFSKNVFKPGKTHYSDLPVQLFTTNTIKIKCNLIKCNIANLKQNDNTLHEFPLKGEPGEKIVERPATLCYYPITTDNIYQLHLKVVDQDDNLIDFRGEKISILLGFRPC